jgi:NitT/TauT family transport system substrate-binding protein
VVIDQGEGSAATINRIVSGAYDAGFGDTNAVIQTAALRPAEAPVVVYMIYSKAPFALLTRRAVQSTRSRTAGKKLARPPAAPQSSCGPRRKAGGFDPASVEVVNMAPNLQEQMLLQGQVDVSAVFTATSYMNLVALTLDPDKDFRWIYYADGGLDLYSNAVMVSAKLAKEKPDAVRGLVRAINRALRETMADPDAAIALLAAKEPLLNSEIEKRRLIYVYKTLIDTPEAQRLGIGDVDDARLAASIATIASSYELAHAPTAAQVFDHAFLPPKADRMPPVLTH